jgi:iron complex outermembrane receptor protein
MFLYTWQAGVFYDLNDHHKLSFTYARKNHFPNMSQRYSTRFGKNLPNPRLGPEIANHFELGYAGGFFDKLQINAALYYSLMTGTIVEVQIPDPDKPSYELNYARNLDSTSFYGFELAPDFFINDYFSGGISFSINGYSLNHSQNDEVKKIPYYPLITLSAYSTIKPAIKTLKEKPLHSLFITPRIEYISSRYDDSAGEQTLSGYFLAHIKCGVELGDNFVLSLAVENVFDKLYEIRYNSPMAGRTYNISLTAKY